MSKVIEIELDGQKREVTQLDVTAHAFGVGTGLVNDLVEKHPLITTNTKYVVKLAGSSHNLLLSGTINLIQDDDKYRAVISTGAGWYTGELVGSATTALATAVAVAAGVAGAPVVIAGIAVLGVSSGVVAGWYGSEKSKDIYDTIREFFGNGSGTNDNTKIERNQQNTIISTTNSLKTFLDNDSSLIVSMPKNQTWDIHATIPSVTNPNNFAEQLSYNTNTKQAIIKTSNVVVEKDSVELLIKKTQANKITINNHTVQIVEPSNLQLRNSLWAIDDYQFLLSNILIYSDEKLDMGSAGVITVKSGDNLSQLAKHYIGGNASSATKRAVLLNPWLADLGRIKFNNTDKVLIKNGVALGNSETEHTYSNEYAQDLFFDANGGFDHYHVEHGDTIIDRGGEGEVYFKGIKLGDKKLVQDCSNSINKIKSYSLQSIITDTLKKVA